MEYIEFSDEIKEALKQAATNWVQRAGGVDGDAVKMYNDFVAPLLGISVGPDGQAVIN